MEAEPVSSGFESGGPAGWPEYNMLQYMHTDVFLLLFCVLETRRRRNDETCTNLFLAGKS